MLKGMVLDDKHLAYDAIKRVSPGAISSLINIPYDGCMMSIITPP